MSDPQPKSLFWRIFERLLIYILLFFILGVPAVYFAIHGSGVVLVFVDRY